MNITKILGTIVVTTLAASPVFAQSTVWSYMGQASSGEAVYVHNRSLVYKGRNHVDFVYKIGGERIEAVAYCQENRWYASGYGTYSPQSRATQRMINFACRADL